jgi:hypothetical protein
MLLARMSWLSTVSMARLLLRPARKRLSDVQRETAGRVFRDEEFIAHLERVAASEDDLPAGQSA